MAPMMLTRKVKTVLTGLPWIKGKNMISNMCVTCCRIRIQSGSASKWKVGSGSASKPRRSTILLTTTVIFYVTNFINCCILLQTLNKRTNLMAQKEKKVLCVDVSMNYIIPLFSALSTFLHPLHVEFTKCIQTFFAYSHRPGES
jgi:hypothetical protein